MVNNIPPFEYLAIYRSSFKTWFSSVGPQGVVLIASNLHQNFYLFLHIQKDFVYWITCKRNVYTMQVRLLRNRGLRYASVNVRFYVIWLSFIHFVKK